MSQITGRLTKALETATRTLLAERNGSAHWTGELSASALSTATAISALSFYLKHHKNPQNRSQIESQLSSGLNWLTTQQNSDGGFGDTDLSYSNISTSMLVVAALAAAGKKDEHGQLVTKTESYIDSQGGIAGLRARYGVDKTFAVPILANCAMAGEVPWREVSALPFEATIVPQSWYRFMQLPVVSYAIPALVAIGLAKHKNDPTYFLPIWMTRALATNRALNVLQSMQPASGGFLEAVPLTSFVVMGLCDSGKADHPVVKLGVKFLLDSFRDEGSWPIDTNLATWGTTLSINALATGEPDEQSLTNLANGECLDWVLSCQHTEPHPFTGASPGGWGWTDLSGAVPDSDDSPGALLALKNVLPFVKDESQKKKIRVAIRSGIKWLLDLQNRDKGWPTFCRGWGKLPFDRSGSDLTAHVLRAFAAWKTELESTKDAADQRLLDRIENATASGLCYLEKQQRADGSWIPLWFGNQDETTDEENPIYGTAKVLLAYRDLGLQDHECCRRGMKWLFSVQNEDGGWGGGPSFAKIAESKGWQTNEHPVHSSVEETALSLEVLADLTRSIAILSKSDANSAKSSTNLNHYHLTNAQAGIDNGVRWLVDAVEQDHFSQVSPIGFYFAKLWYHERLYPIIFTVAALRSAAKALKEI